MSKHDDWRHAAGQACSYRRMYALAREIMDESDHPNLRREASRVHDILENVIDKPVASSKQLQEARRRYTTLLNCLVSLDEAQECVMSVTPVSQAMLLSRSSWRRLPSPSRIKVLDNTDRSDIQPVACIRI